MTNDEIKKLRELEKAATPGPWYADCGGSELSRRWHPEQDESETAYTARATITPDKNCEGWETDSGYPMYTIPQADAELAVAARNALPGLLDDYEALRARVAALEKALIGLSPGGDCWCRYNGEKHTGACDRVQKALRGEFKPDGQQS